MIELKNYFKVILSKPYHTIKSFALGIIHNKNTAFLLKLSPNPKHQRIFYFGATSGTNLGDRAQSFCIERWIKANYSDSNIYILSALDIIDPMSHFFERFKTIYNKNDIIIFQSGYNINDMGANHPLMHKIFLENYPNAKMLMMPESIFYHSEENMIKDSLFYRKGLHFLFLARDSKSLELLKNMCPNLPKRAFPDIVTTLIGEYSFTDKRTNNICLCRRNDGEKFYSENELLSLVDKIKDIGCNVIVTDTTIDASPKAIANNMKWYIEQEIKKFSTYKCIVTDRFHGVVFSLIAGTPVVVIKTNNHKVTQALEWFKGVYDDYVYYANDLSEAFMLVKEINRKDFDHIMKPYFKEQYYDKLKEYFNDVIS